MAGDRSGLRNIYPGVLSLTESDVQRLLKQAVPSYADPNEYQDYLRSLAEDVQRIRDGVSMVAWPVSDDTMINCIRLCAWQVCMFRLCQISKIAEAQKGLEDALRKLGIGTKDWRKGVAQFSEAITEEEFSELKQIYRRWDEVFLTIPVDRLKSSENWMKPFDAVDAALREANYPVMNCDLDQMHTQIVRGHNWFGVGEWNIANRHYLNALCTAIGTNNCDAIEAVVRFLVDTYVAAGDFQSAVNITTDFLDSPAFLRSSTKAMTAEMLEAVAVAFALERHLDKCQEWIKRIPVLCGRSPHDQVSKWNIVQSLADVYRFRQNSRALFALNSATKETGELL